MKVNICLPYMYIFLCSVITLGNLVITLGN